MTLALIWSVSLALLLLSLLATAVLVAQRELDSWLEDRRRRRRDRLESLLLDHLDGRAEPSAILAALPRRHGDLALARAVCDIARHLRGRELDRLQALLRALDLPETLLRRLRSATGSAAAELVELLAVITSPRVIEALAAAARSPDAPLREAALRALMRLDPDRLLQLLQEPRSPLLLPRSELTARLAILAGRTRPRLLVDLLDGAPAAAAVTLLEGLGHSSDYAVADTLAAHLAHPDPNLRAAALAALGRLGAPDMADAVREALHDPVWYVRAKAAGAALALALDELVPDLARLLDDGEWWVRYQAARALHGLGRAGRAILAETASRTGPAGRVSQMMLAEHARDGQREADHDGLSLQVPA